MILTPEQKCLAVALTICLR